MIRHLHASLAAAVCFLGGCTDFDLPSALTREQIIAVRSTPSALEPGSRGELEAVVAGPDGVVEEPVLSWSIDPLMAGVSSASIEVDDDGRAWLAVDEDAAPGGVVIVLEVAGEDGPITARKTVEVTDQARENPGPMGLEAEGQPVVAAVEVAAGASIELAASAESADEPRYSWYATVGEIERFRHNPTELVAPAEPAEGWLIAVVRDDAGGVAWEIRPLIVTP